jgi:hypothetical protein
MSAGLPGVKETTHVNGLGRPRGVGLRKRTRMQPEQKCPGRVQLEISHGPRPLSVVLFGAILRCGELGSLALSCLVSPR